MYAHIKGNVEEIYADRVVIEAAGVGYELVCSKMTLKKTVRGQNRKAVCAFSSFAGQRRAVRFFLMQRNGQCSESS